MTVQSSVWNQNKTCLILWGWHTLNLTCESKAPPGIRNLFDEVEPVGFNPCPYLSVHDGIPAFPIMRLNLNSGQWACIAAEADDLLAVIAEEAEGRMKAGVRPPPNPRQKIAEGSPDNNKTATKAAELFNTNRTYVNQAVKMKEAAPEAWVVSLTKIIPCKTPQKRRNWKPYEYLISQN
jgi:hypothetical protein